MAADAARRTTTCPDCGGPVRPDSERLCRRCGYPLMFLREAPDPTALAPARTPGERDDATSVLRNETRLTTMDDAPPPMPGEVVCPRCGERNPPERIRCQRCGLELRTGQPVSLPPPPPAPPPRRSMRRLWPVVGALTAAAVLIGGAVVLATLGPDLSRSQEPEQQTAAGPTDLVRVRSADITPSASSTIADRRFPVANTVDGDPATAWQSDGRRQPSNIGVTLTFEFASPVRLARITIVNGYARTPGDFANNQRVARLRVSSGDWSARWELTDSRDPQTLDVDAGELEAVTFEVEAVYQGNRFKDLAVSEVAFDARP